MTTYSIRCRHKACRHRRVSHTHPDEYKVVPKCPMCGRRKGWRIEQRDYNKKGTKKHAFCKCDGPTMAFGRWFPHRTNHPLCDNNPDGERNQVLARGVAPDDLPLELMGEVCCTEEPPF